MIKLLFSKRIKKKNKKSMMMKSVLYASILKKEKLQLYHAVIPKHAKNVVVRYKYVQYVGETNNKLFAYTKFIYNILDSSIYSSIDFISNLKFFCLTISIASTNC